MATIVTAAEIARMRAAKNALIEEYQEVQREALKTLYDFMKETKIEMTAAEMSAVSGLSVAEIAFHANRRTESGMFLSRPDSFTREITAKYAEVREDGTVNLDNTIVRTRKIRVYTFGPAPWEKP